MISCEVNKKFVYWTVNDKNQVMGTKSSKEAVHGPSGLLNMLLLDER